MNRTVTLVFVVVAAVLIVVVSFESFATISTPQTSPEATQYTYNIINMYPHDENAFTEGLLYKDGFLYESTGLNGASTLRKVNLTSGEILQQVRLSSTYFGEGIAFTNGKIVQLTYTTKIAFIYNQTTFALLGNFSYATQGWGLTNDGKQLIMSDGSDNLYFLNPETYEITGQIRVQDGNVSVSKLNELEYINGDIYANIFEQSTIAIINPQTGQIKGWVDLSGLVAQESTNSWSVLNGIAYDDINDRLFVTGKNWAHLYEISLIAK